MTRTDWNQIRLLYDRLQALTPSPVVLLNRAVATRYVVGPEAALAEITPLAAELDGYRLFHALRAGLLAGLGRDDEARAASERALALAGNPAERELPRPPPVVLSTSAVTPSHSCRASHLHRGPDLDRDPAPVHPGPGLGDLHGLLDGVGLEHREPAERLLGLHERPVGDAARAHRPGRGRRCELVPARRPACPSRRRPSRTRPRSRAYQAWPSASDMFLAASVSRIRMTYFTVASIVGGAPRWPSLTSVPRTGRRPFRHSCQESSRRKESSHVPNALGHPRLHGQDGLVAPLDVGPVAGLASGHRALAGAVRCMAACSSSTRRWPSGRR